MTGTPLSQVVVGDALGEMGESMWIEVIHKMDAIYADLVRHQEALERKNAALEEAQRFIDSVLAAMSDVLVVADPQGRIQRVNQALVTMTGHDADAWYGRPLADLFVPAWRSWAEALPRRIRREAVNDVEVTMVGAAGESVPLAVNAGPRYDCRGRYCGLVLTGRHLGELQRAYRDLKAAQQQLVQAEKLASLGRLIAGVAHELNNPISFVFANMHALRRYGDRIRRYLTAVHEGVSADELAALRRSLRIDRVLEDMGPLIDGSLEGAERVSVIVQNLRRFSAPRVQSPAWFDLPRLVRKVVTWVTRNARIVPRTSFDLPDELSVFGTEGHVHQILVNLVQNAVDAVEGLDRPRLSVRVVAEAEWVRVVVHDNGPGIPEANLLKIFDPFFTTKEVGKGTGLGLYISYELAREQCGGDLSVRNHPEGGAEFTLTLPRGPSRE